MSPWKNLGLRPERYLGLGRLRGRIHRGAVDESADEGEGARIRSQRRVSPVRRRKGPSLFRLFSYVRYLNQRNIDASYQDSFGVEHPVQQRQDIQLAKFFAPFSGWFLSPKVRYYLYVWSSNASQGDPAQVVGGGNMSYVFNRFVTVGGGIAALPTVRSTEGQFPYWLGVDARLIADEFFRGSYTNGVWVKGDLFQKLKYNVMFATNLSILGVSASQIDNKMDTQSYALNWLQRRRSSLRVRRLRSPREGGDADRPALVPQPRGQAEPAEHQRIENSQIRLTDGSVVHPESLWQGTRQQRRLHDDEHRRAGISTKAWLSRASIYRRRLTNCGRQHRRYRDHRQRLQLQSSAMVVGDVLQLYLSGSQIFWRLRRPVRSAHWQNWHFMKKRLRLNTEHPRESQPGRLYTHPMPVGARQYHPNPPTSRWTF